MYRTELRRGPMGLRGRHTRLRGGYMGLRRRETLLRRREMVGGCWTVVLDVCLRPSFKLLVQ